MGAIPSSSVVLKAQRTSSDHQAPFAPPAIDLVVSAIKAEKPDVVFAPHVETASGIMLPDAYLRAVADAVQDGDRLADAMARHPAIFPDVQVAAQQ